MGEHIKRIVSGYMDNMPSGSPRDPSSWIEDEDSKQRTYKWSTKSFLFSDIAISEVDYMKIIYLLSQLGVSNKLEKTLLIERLLHAAISEALEEYAAQVNQDSPTVNNALLQIGKDLRKQGIEGQVHKK